MREFFARVEATPSWVDPELVGYGAQVFRRFGRNANDVLLALSLIGGYRFGGPVDLVAETGGLSAVPRRVGSARPRRGRTRWARPAAWPATAGGNSPCTSC
nr:hypothetical protein [Gordonia oryzae]